MKLQLTNRAKVLGVVVVFAAAGAAAWFLFLQDWLAGPPPAPMAASKPAAVPAKPAAPEAPKPAAAEAPKPAAEAPKPAAQEPAKPAASKEPAKPTAKETVAKKAPPKVSPVAKELAREAAKPAPKDPAPAPELVKPEPEPAPAPVAAAESPKPAATEPPKPAPVSLVPAALRGPSIPGPRFADLVTAVIYRDVAGVEELLRFGKWPDKADSRGQTPLMLAVDLGDATIAETLLKAGADPGRAMTTARAKGPAFVSMLERYTRATP